MGKPGHGSFELAGAIAKAINLDSRARYPGAVEGTDSGVEASCRRGTRTWVVHFGPDALSLLIADIERVAAASPSETFRAQCAAAIATARAEAESPEDRNRIIVHPPWASEPPRAPTDRPTPTPPRATTRRQSKTMVWTDPDGRTWQVMDVALTPGKADGAFVRRAVPLGELTATQRGFVPYGWTGAVRVLELELIDDHHFDEQTFREQIRRARPV